MRVSSGDTLVAFNPVMDFSSAPLTVGKEYTVTEFVEGGVGCMQMVRLVADNGKVGIFDLARFKSKEFYDKHMESYYA